MLTATMRSLAWSVSGCALLLCSAACERAEPTLRFQDAQRLGGLEVPADVLNNGAMLYERYCSSCHGLEGDGKGPAAASLAEKPSNFQQARFRHAGSSPDQLPSHEALMAIIQRGVPANGMPAWKGLREEDLSALASYIKTFSKRWRDEPAG